MTLVYAIGGSAEPVVRQAVSGGLAVALALAEREVLLIDLDPAHSLATTFGFLVSDLDHGFEAVASGALSLAAAAKATSHPGLRLVPAVPATTQLELALCGVGSAAPDLEQRLIQALADGASGCDTLILHLPGGYGPVFLAAHPLSTQFLVPTGSRLPEYDQHWLATTAPGVALGLLGAVSRRAAPDQAPPPSGGEDFPLPIAAPRGWEPGLGGQIDHPWSQAMLALAGHLIRRQGPVPERGRLAEPAIIRRDLANEPPGSIR